MIENLKYFSIFPEAAELLLNEFSDEECGRIVKIALDYVLNGVEPDMSKCSHAERIVCKMIKNGVDASIAKARKKAETSQQNGAKGGRPPKNQGDNAGDDQPADQNSDAPDESMSAKNTGYSRFKIACTDGTYIPSNGEIECLKSSYSKINVEDQISRLAYYVYQNPEKRDTIENTRTKFLPRWLNNARPDTDTANAANATNNTPLEYPDESIFVGLE